jgi:hypothetical protein
MSSYQVKISEGCFVCGNGLRLYARTYLTGFRLLPQYWGREKDVLFLRGCISLNFWSYRPLLRAGTSPFKSACLLIKLKLAKVIMYGLTVLWHVPDPTF